MFTVVAVDTRLEPLLKDYLPLYETAREEQIRMIHWNRQGDSVANALPQLEEQVQEQNEWRILLVGDEDAVRTRNPFDTDRSMQALDYVRCAQMLGHIPPQVTFHEEEGHVISRIDAPDQHEREERRFTDPDQILLLAVTQERQDIKKMRSIRNEDAVDPEFWDRCDYPANCRFLKMNLLRNHNIVTPNARMELAMGIHTLAFNEIPSSDLQAYELYNLIIELNEENEFAGFSEYYSRLQAIELRLQRTREFLDRVREKNAAQEMPKIRNEIDVEVYNEQPGSLTVSKKGFTLVKDRPKLDERLWKERREEVDENLEKYLKQPRRALKQAAREARRKGIFDAGADQNGRSVYLDEFQLEDIHEKVDQLELEMAQCEAADILRQDAFREEQDEAQQEVRRIMRRRSGLGTTVLTIVVALIFYALGFVPFVMTASRMQLLSESLIVSGALILIVAIAALGALIYNRHLLMAAIANFNALMRDIVKRVQDSSRQYSSYLTALSSFMKGKSLLYQLMHGDESLDENEKLLRMHVHRLKECQRQLEEWCRPLDRAPSRIYSQDSVRGFDYMREDPKTSLYYVYQRGEQTYPVHLNEDAEYLRSPFSFIDQMIIRKEAES